MLDKPVNENYAATVVRVKHVNQLEGCDNIVGLPLLGFQAIVSKDTELDTLGIVFPAETQLSHDFAAYNNLYRHSELNFTVNAKGYLEDNRRVRAVKLRGHRSDALFLPLTSLAYFQDFDPADFKEGDTFDKVYGEEICRKYYVKEPKEFVGQPKKERRVEEKYFPKHFDTANYYKHIEDIQGWERVVVTQKLHGTSIRVGNVPVKRKLSWWEKVAQYFGAKVQEYEYQLIAGSRNVIKDPADKEQDHFYDTDIWTHEALKLDGLIPKDFIIYGELIGWTPNNEPIQRNYTYQIPQGMCKLYVYRVVHVNADGLAVDLSWDQVLEFCQKNFLDPVPTLWNGYYDRFDPARFIDVKYQELGYPGALPLDPGTVDEGCCIRAEGLTPRVLKCKSPEFLRHETKLLDKGLTDTESNA